MTSVTTARALRSTGLGWEPARGDRFVIPDRDMDADVFVLSDMTIEAHDFPTGRVLGFNGTTEWALDSVEADAALWLPREGQLREHLGEAFVRLDRRPDAWAVTTAGVAGPATTVHPDVEEAYALALLSVRARTARDLLPVAAHEVTVRVHALDEEAWGLEVLGDGRGAGGSGGGRSVRGVVTSLAAELRWSADLLAGRSVEAVGSRYEGDVLGPDPVAGWDAAAAASLAAWAAADPAGDLVLPTGPTPAGAYAEQVLMDLVVAAWDLARATGQDEHLDPAAVRHVLAHVRPRAAQWSVAGVLAPPVDLGADAPAGPDGVQAELLALTGRDPR